jgi:hypothetical protein
VVAGIVAVVVVIVICVKKRRGMMPEDPEREIIESALSIERVLDEWKPYEFVETLRAEICSICLGDSMDVETACRHYYHSGCLTMWTLRKKTCPQCRTNLSPHIRFICPHCNHNYKDLQLTEVELLGLDKRCYDCISKSVEP